MISKKAPDISPAFADPAAQALAIKNNDDKTLKHLYVENYKLAERYILQNSGSHEEAKDIYQEAFIAVWRNIKLDRFQAQNEASFKNYLMQVLRNKWIDRLRSDKTRKSIPLMHDEVEEKIDLIPEDQEEKINSIKLQFRQLGQTCREVLTRFYYNNESLKTIAGALNWTEATARNNKYRCLQKLRELLKTK